MPTRSPRTSSRPSKPKSSPPPRRDDWPRDEDPRPAPAPQRAAGPPRKRKLEGMNPALPGDGYYRPCPADKDRNEFWQERAAIRQFLDGNDRQLAERLAHEDTLNAWEQGLIP